MRPPVNVDHCHNPVVMVLRALSSGDVEYWTTVGGLAETTGETREAVTYVLGVLKKKGLVQSRTWRSSRGLRNETWRWIPSPEVSEARRLP